MGSTAYIVLAAGSGRRFGGGKLDAELSGKAVGRWTTDAVERTGAIDRFIVVGNDRPAFVADLKGWNIVINTRADAGIGTSLGAAIAAARDYDRVVIALADMPFVTAEYLKALADREGAVFTRHPDGRAGVPAAFPNALFPELLSLPDDQGAAAIAKRVAAEILEPGNRSALTDIDTPADLADCNAATGDESRPSSGGVRDR